MTIKEDIKMVVSNCLLNILVIQMRRNGASPLARWHLEDKRNSLDNIPLQSFGYKKRMIF